MKGTLYILDELWTQLDQYLKDYSEQNPSSVVPAVLVEKLHPKNASRLLSLAGILENASTYASVNEDYLILWMKRIVLDASLILFFDSIIRNITHLSYITA